MTLEPLLGSTALHPPETPTIPTRLKAGASELGREIDLGDRGRGGRLGVAGLHTTQWSTPLSSKVNLPQAINFRGGRISQLYRQAGSVNWKGGISQPGEAPLARGGAWPAPTGTCRVCACVECVRV